MSLKTVSRAVITGNTYNNRDAIKDLGGKWDKDAKAWVIDIARHPRNTMRGRGGLDNDLRAISQKGCTIKYE